MALFIKDGKMQRTIRVDTKKSNDDKMGSPDWSDLDLEEFLYLLLLMMKI